MSTRHLKRLQKVEGTGRGLLLEAEDEEDEDEMQDSPNINEFEDKLRYVFPSSSSSSSSSESESEGEVDELKVPAVASTIKQSTPSQSIKKEENEEDIDALLLEFTSVGNVNQQAKIEKVSARSQWEIDLLSINSQSLDIDTILRKRFIGLVGKENMSNKVSYRKHQLSRTILFGKPTEQWYKPPLFIAGGLGMEQVKSDAKNDNFIKLNFIFSSEYEKLQYNYEQIKLTGDCNRIFIFTVQNPYFVESLLALGNIYIRIGNIDRGTMLIRRAIYVLEHAFLHSFKIGNNNQRFYLDATHSINKLFYDCLFKYMQIACLNGCSSVSAELGKLIISLDYSDSYCVVLLLDHYLLQSSSYETILKYMGIESMEVELSVSKCMELTSSYRLDADEPALTVTDLPNWWYTLTVAYLNKNQHSNADIALQYAISIAPNFIKSLLKQIDPSKLTSSAWKDLLNHSYFTTTTGVVEIEEFYDRLSEGYALRNHSIWSKESNINFMLKIVKKFVNSSVNIKEGQVIQEKIIKKWQNNKKLMKKYMHNIELDDFKEEFPRMPAEANPLDNNIANPDLLDNEQGALAFQPNAAMIGLEDLFLHYLFNNNRNNHHQGIFGRQLFRGWRLDLTAPLLQLLWMSLLPWYYL